MQTPSNRTVPMLLNTEEELFNHFVKAGHPFRKLAHIIDFPKMIDPLRTLYSDLGTMRIQCQVPFLGRP
jgi:hypothetical protein